jgi:hypothetical protein
MRQKQKRNQTMKMMKKDDHHPAAARLIIISHNLHNTHMVASELGRYHHRRLLQQSHPAGEREREREREREQNSFWVIIFLLLFKALNAPEEFLAIWNFKVPHCPSSMLSIENHREIS